MGPLGARRSVARATGRALALLCLGSIASNCTAPNPLFVGRTTDARTDAANDGFDVGSETAPREDVPGTPDDADPALDTVALDVSDDLAAADVGPALDMITAPDTTVTDLGPQPDVDPPDRAPPPEVAPPVDSAGPSDDTAPAPDADEYASLRSGLVGHWPFDEGNGRFAADESRLGNQGELLGGAGWSNAGFPALFANPACLSLDGDNDEVRPSVVGLPDIGAPKSISVWAWFPDPLPASVRKNLFSLSRGVDGMGIQIGFDSGRASMWLRGESSALLVSAVLPARTWHHITYVFDGTRHQLFVKGVQVDESSERKHTGVPTALFFGAWGGTAQYFPGRIDDLRFYDRALGPREVADLSAGH